MLKQSKRTGRPPKAAVPGKRMSLGLKVTPSIKERLDRAALETGRTQSQEAEARLERTFYRQDLLPDALELSYGKPLAGILMAIGAAMRDASRSYEIEHARELEAVPNWALVPDAYDLALNAGTSILDMLRPIGEFASSSEPTGQLSPEQIREIKGRHFATRTRQAMADNRALSADRREEGAAIRRLLGPITPTLRDIIGPAAANLNEENEQ